jgi:proteasome accessory factor A
VATFLKVGTTAFLLCLVEDEAIGRSFVLRSPVAAMRQVSHDLTLARPLELDDGTTVTALEVQWELLDRSRKWAEEHGMEAVGGEQVGTQVLDEWEQVLTGLEADPALVADRVDWVAKQRLLEGYRDRHGLAWDDPRLAALSLQYHDLRPERSLSDRAGLRRLVEPAAAERAMTEPPSDTRAYFRGRCLQRWAPQVVAANWDSIVFDVGASSLRRVPMMEPLRGTAAHVGTLVDESADPAELLARLSG